MRKLGALLVFLLGCATSPPPTDSTQPTPSVPSAAPAAAVASAPAASAAAAAAPDPSLCPLNSADGWKACDGKLVEVRGKAPQMVMQHPMLTGPSLPGHKALHQGYLDAADGRQIILLSAEPIACPGSMRVRGTLHGIDMGGPEGTKTSYKGYSIQDAVATCE
ncbi:MAG TPA: hypothetical protein PK156_14495 [Polyangium sp.]|nr:hypothetical protein [Polyangium sp.]